MAKLHRCPKCGVIDIWASVRHLFRYLSSARYRQSQRKARVKAASWDRLTSKPKLMVGVGDTWAEINLGCLTEK